MRYYQSAEEKFWVMIDKNGPIPMHKPELGPCWKWAGGNIRGWYSRLYVLTHSFLAHRFSWELHFGKIPDGLQVLHKCDNPPCTNPSHLFIGTSRDNVRDMWEKRRMSTQGEKWDGPKQAWPLCGKGDKRRKHVKLNAGQVSEIRKTYAAGELTYSELAERFQLPRTTIHSALNKWKNLETICA